MLRVSRADACPIITKIAPNEPTRFNPECLEDLCHEMGEVRAEAEVAMALHRISETLPNLDALLQSDAQRFLARTDQVAIDAERIGMATLARVARNVVDAYASDNPTALAATLARLNRVGERSIHAVWDLEDISV
jgi:hypothetical protein